MNQKLILRKLGKTFAVYGVQIWVMLFVANLGLITFIRFKANAQSCMTQTQIDTDSRCLYVLSGNIYQKGSRNSPHQSHPCGMDVTSIIPSFHTNSANQYLLPNFVGSVCTAPLPTPVPTTAPTANPTAQPTSVPTSAPTSNPTSAPTNLPAGQPTNNATAHPTTVPTIRPTQQGTPTPTSSSTQNPTASVSPIPASITPDIGKFGSKLSGFVTTTLDTPEPTSAPVEVPRSALVDQYNLIYWTTIFSYISFILLLVTGGYWVVQKVRTKNENLAA